MEVTARGWGRNMGDKELGSIDVSELRLNKDQNKRLWFNSPQIFSSWPNVEVHWGKELHMTGRYRMEIKLTRADIVRLFKASFGTELDVDLLRDYGFTVSDDL